MRKKVFAMLLAAALCVGLLPTSALAEGEQSVEDIGTDEIISEEIVSEETMTEETVSEEEKVEQGEVDAETETETAEPESEEEEYVIQTLADGDDAVAKVESTGEEYTSIADAFAAAENDDTVTLLTDTTVDVGSKAYVTVSKNITMDLDNFTITVNGTSTSTSSYGSLFNVDAGVTFTLKNGTIDGGTGEGEEKEATANVNAVQAEGAESTVILNSVTVQYFLRSTGSVRATNAKLNVSECNFIDNYRAITCHDGVISECDFEGNGIVGSRTVDSGAAVYATTTTGIEITDCTFENNSVSSQGGAVSASSSSSSGDDSSVFIKGNTFTYNSALYGGAIGIGTVRGQLAVTGNTISNNSARYGGGIYFSTDYNGSVTDDYDFSGNTVTNNSADERGGGMRLFAQYTNREIIIRSGTIANNFAYDYGGGIDYTGHSEATLRLYNALITDNSAYRGGGLWACPSAVTTMHMVFGGAIYGNTASGESTSTGDSIRYEGTDSDEFEDSGGVFVTVSPRALGGGLEDWYADDAGNRYTKGDEPVDVTEEKYNDTNLSFGLHGELTGTSLELAQDSATLYIYNNETYGYGGGVATNAVVDFGGIPGEEPEDEFVNVKAEKVWKDADGNTINDHASSIDVTLVRVDEDGNKQDLETVTLSEETDWSWEFKDLPAYYMVVADDGSSYTTYNYTYELRETAVKGFDTEYTTQKDDEGNIVITITNTTNREYFPIDEEIVTDEDDIFNRDAWVKNESVNEYNAIEIEMTTNLPVVTVNDLETGAFTMNFHEVLDHELVLDEETTDFTVYIAETPVSTAYYTITFDDDTGDDCNFHVDVDLTALYKDGIVTEEMLDGNTEITIFFFADLEGTGLNGSYTSTVWYEIYDGEELQYTSNVDVVAVYTYEILINKTDSETNEPLAGAVFGVYYDEDCNEDSAVSRNNEPYTTVSEDNGEAIFYGLAEGTYYVKELQAPEGYQLSNEVLTIELSDETVDEEHIYYDTFENEPEPESDETRDIAGTKTWDDDDNKADARPASITVNLYQNDELYDSKTVTEADGWAWSWTGLPKYDEDGTAYAYTIDEETIDYYTPTYHEGNFDITNTFVGEEGAEHPTTGPDKGGDTPKTGDTNNLGLWIALLAVAIVAVFAAVRMRKRS